jgi:hypothetical protein
MGGSGGGSVQGADSWRPSNLDASLERTRQREREAEVAEVIDAVIRAINQVDTEALNRHKQTILDALNDQFDGVYDLRGGGSYTRHTHVSGLSDVDVLLDLGAYADSDIAHKDDPSAVRREMERRLRQRLPSTEITAGKMAVTVRFRDGSEIQVLPAFRTGTGYRIPDPDGDGWTVTRPQVFARLLAERSREIGGGLRRSIKLAKLICANQGIDVHSYHLENMAMTAFDHYVGPKTAPAMLRHFFAQAKVLTLRPMPDVTGQNAHVDRYLETPAARQRLAKQLRSVEQQIADAADDKDIWREILRT